MTKGELCAAQLFAGVQIQELYLVCFCVIGWFSVTPFFCLCLLILCEREKACAFIMCPITYSFGFPPLLTVSVLAVFVASLMESWRDGCLFLWLEAVVFPLAFALTVVL